MDNHCKTSKSMKALDTGEMFWTTSRSIGNHEQHLTSTVSMASNVVRMFPIRVRANIGHGFYWMLNGILPLSTCRLNVFSEFQKERLLLARRRALIAQAWALFAHMQRCCLRTHGRRLPCLPLLAWTTQKKNKTHDSLHTAMGHPM